ncbi:MAG TPA: leucine-rich repeat domain-containing protein [Rhabdochlamydiaceae bacterium]|nr:leucine-rich repeat domain-containing protein [Rhabdochlamydiaceae bacterium]
MTQSCSLLVPPPFSFEAASKAQEEEKSPRSSDQKSPDKTIDVYEALEKGYCDLPILKPIADRVCADFPLSPCEFVTGVYQRVIAEAQKFPNSEVVLSNTRGKHDSIMAPMDPSRLQEIVEWTNASKNAPENASDTLKIFKKIAEQISFAAQTFLSELKSNPNLTVIQRAEQVCVWMRENKAALARINYLDLSNLGLAYLPPEIGLLRELRSLDLGNNRITDLPTEVEDLSKLRYLYLNNNKLNSVPEVLTRLSVLKELYLNNYAGLDSKNQLTTVPAELGNLGQLEVLDLSNIQLIRVPAELGNLRVLRELNLSHNQLTELPVELGNLKQLLRFNFSHNRITKLPNEVLKLSAFIRFDFSHNPLSMPKELVAQLHEYRSILEGAERLTPVKTAIIFN